MTTLWRHHAVYGQSLAIGTASTDYVPSDPEYPDNTGQPTAAGFVDLDINAVEVTPRSRPKHSLGARVFEQYRDGVQSGDTDAFISVEQAGASGLNYTQLKKGTEYWDDLLDRVGWFHTFAGTDDEVDALHWIHGTSNSATAQATYLGYLEELQADFDADAKAVTGQSADIPVTMSQHWSSGTTIGEIGPQLAAVDAHRDASGLFRLAGPRYHLERNTDSLPHLTGRGYYMLGEYHARAFEPDFEPLIPTSVIMVGATITVTFPATSQLAFDTTLVAANVNHGFDYTDDGTPPAITNVAISGANRVVVTLASTPSGANPKLGYGRYISTDSDNAAEGWRGNLRDSDTAVTAFGDSSPLYNWCCHFLDAITVVPRSNLTGTFPTAIAGASGRTLTGITA